MSAAHVIDPFSPETWEAEFTGWKMSGGLGTFVAKGPFRVRLVRQGGGVKNGHFFFAMVHMGGGENWKPLEKGMQGAEDLAWMKSAVGHKFTKQAKSWSLIGGGPLPAPPAAGQHDGGGAR